MNTNSQTRKLQKDLLVAKGAVCRQKTQIMLDAMRSDLQLGTSPARAASGMIKLFAGAVGPAAIPSLLVCLVGDLRLTRWLSNIRQTLRLSQLALDIFQVLSSPNSKKIDPSIVRERTDATASDN